MTDSSIAVVGGGPAGLMAATRLAEAGHRVDLFERMPTVGRKFLLAGRGGLNLTHSEPLPRFLDRYREASGFLAPAIDAFSPDDLRTFAHRLGQPTFIGTSGRVFPAAMKASPLLRAWLQRLGEQGVTFHLRHRLTRIAGTSLIFETSKGEVERTYKAVVLALGGASWPKLGADGSWVPMLEALDVPVAPLASANAGIHLAWSETMRARRAGDPLKRIALTVGTFSVRGEAIITTHGLEGGVIYAAFPDIRRRILAHGKVTILLDLLPDMTIDRVAARLKEVRAGASLNDRLRRLGLSPAAVDLIRDALQNRVPAAPEALATAIKRVELTVTGIEGLERAISTAGGASLAAVDANYMVRSQPGLFLAGEMLDWEAPTGGYLLQACFATGHAAGSGVLRWLAGT